MFKNVIFIIAIGLLTWAIYASLRSKNEIRPIELTHPQSEQNGTFVNKNSDAAGSKPEPLKKNSVSTITNQYSQPLRPQNPPKKIKNVRSGDKIKRVESKNLSLNEDKSWNSLKTPSSSLAPTPNSDLKADADAVSPDTSISPPQSEKVTDINQYVPPKMEVYVSGGAFYHRVDGKDRNNNTNALLLSQVSFYADVGLKIHLLTDPRWYMRTQITLSDYRYKKDLSADLISDQNVFTPGFHIGVGRLCWDWFTPEIFAGVDREFFYFSPVLNRIEFDSDWISKIGVMTESKWVLKNHIGLGFKTLFSYMRFGDTLDDGYEISGGPMLSYKSVSLNFDFQFDHKNMPSLTLETIQARSYIRYDF